MTTFTTPAPQKPSLYYRLGVTLTKGEQEKCVEIEVPGPGLAETLSVIREQYRGWSLYESWDLGTVHITEDGQYPPMGFGGILEEGQHPVELPDHREGYLHKVSGGWTVEVWDVHPSLEEPTPAWPIPPQPSSMAAISLARQWVKIAQRDVRGMAIA